MDVGADGGSRSTSDKGVPRSAHARDAEFRIENTPYEKRLPSCAECRRLKRRCDRKWPCQSCIARGCASICPNGSLSTEGGGSRSILRKIKEMSKRIGQLEDALTAVWAGNETHPLLRPELLKIKSLPDTSAANNDEEEEHSKQEPAVKTEDEVEALSADIDTLTLGTNGKMNYMGRTAKYEFILKAEELDPTRAPSADHPSPPTDAPTPAPSLPQSITDLSHSFLLTAPLRHDITLNELRRYLPSYRRAQSLVDFFYTNAGWFYSPLPRDEFLEDIVSCFYPQEYAAASNHPAKKTGSSSDSSATATTTKDGSPASTRCHGAHDLALLFLVLAFGMQLEAPYATHSEDSEVYQTLSRAALSLEPITNGCSLSLIQTLELMIYRSHFDHNNAQQEFLWGIMGLASKFALTLGLHRDCEKWDIPQREINRRRYVFWELFSCNAWTALGSGRPPSLQLAHTDCQLPLDPAERTAHSGKVTSRSFYNWKHHFVRDCLWPVIEQNSNLVKTFNYSAIMALDRKIREFDFGSLDRESLKGNGKNPNPNVGLLLQRWINKNCKDHVILQMHRVFFARALQTHPNSPLDSPYSSSVLATFKCAVTLLQEVESIYEQAPPEFVPFGVSWSYLLTCGMTMGTLCNKGPRGSFAPHAFARLQSVVTIAETRFGRSQRAQKGLPMLQNLLTAAAAAITPLGPGPTSSLEAPALAAPPAASETEQIALSESPPDVETKAQIEDVYQLKGEPDSVSPHTQWQGRVQDQQQTSGSNVDPVRDFQRPFEPLVAQTPQTPHAYYMSSTIPEADYNSFTLQHQPTTSYRPLGMPIPPDDFVWSEPPVDRPLKRYRYSEETILNSTTSGAPMYADPSQSNGEVSPHMGSMPGVWPPHHRPVRSSSFSRPPMHPHSLSLNMHDAHATSSNQWSHPGISTPTMSVHSYDTGSASTPVHAYAVYNEQTSNSPIHPHSHPHPPGVNMSGPYGTMPWQSYSDPHSDPSNRGV